MQTLTLFCYIYLKRDRENSNNYDIKKPHSQTCVGRSDKMDGNVCSSYPGILSFLSLLCAFIQSFILFLLFIIDCFLRAFLFFPRNENSLYLSFFCHSFVKSLTHAPPPFVVVVVVVVIKTVFH